MIQILRHDDWQNGRHAKSNLAATGLIFIPFVFLRLYIIVTVAISNFSLPAAAQSVVSDDIKHDTPGKTIQQEQSVHIDVNLALVNVTVTDPYDRVVTGLEPDNFRVFENNVKQEIQYFSSEDVPVSIGVIFDLSGSMANKVGKAKEAAMQFFKTANPQDEFSWSVSMSAQSSSALLPTAPTICRVACSRLQGKAARRFLMRSIWASAKRAPLETASEPC
jgi:hypothetical protein